MSKLVYGVGINDYEGSVSYYKNGKRKKIKSYQTWQGMIERCYSVKYQEKKQTYIGCKVSKKWLSYSNFKKWFDLNYFPELSEDIKFELDKDLLFKGNKIYSENTCVFLPRRINSFIATKRLNNTSGYTGVTQHKLHGKWVVQINDFYTGKRTHLGCFDNIQDASKKYKENRILQSNKAKHHMRDLNIYSEDIIKLIK